MNPFNNLGEERINTSLLYKTSGVSDIVSSEIFPDDIKKIRYYILPIERNDVNRGPKYLKWRSDPDPPGIDCIWSMKDYGLIDAGLVACYLTQDQHNTLSIYSDVASAPENIDQNIQSNAVSKVQTVLETLRIPAAWVNTTFTYRQILRMVGGLFLFAQTYHGMHNEQLIENVGQLNLQWNQIPTATQNKIIAVADILGYDYSDVQGTWLVRQILKYLGDQWGDTPILFGFVTL